MARALASILLLALAAAVSSRLQGVDYQLVLVGATGDLGGKYTLRAAYSLWKATGRKLRVYAVGRGENTQAAVRNALTADTACGDASDAAARAACAEDLEEFHSYAVVSHVAADDAGYAALWRVLDKEAADPTKTARAIHLGVPPSAVVPVATSLAAVCGRSGADGRATLLVEKPFGTDGASSAALGAGLAGWKAACGPVGFVDHYLAKGGVNAIADFRRAAGQRFASLWHWRRLNHVAAVAEEAIGAEGREAFYEEAGGFLRDSAQNHMTEMLAFALAPLQVPDRVVDASRAVAAATANQTEVEGAAEPTTKSRDDVNTGGHHLAWSAGVMDPFLAVDEGGSCPPVQPATTDAARLAAPQTWGDVAGIARPGRGVAPAFRAAFARSLAPASPLNKDNVALLLGQYAGYRAAVGSPTTTATAARVTLAAARFRAPEQRAPGTTVVAAPDILGVPVVVAGGKRLGGRRALVRLAFGPRGRLTFLVQGTVPVVVAEPDALASGLPVWPANASHASLFESQRHFVASLHGTGTRIVNVTGPAVILERPAAYNTQLVLPAAVPSSMRVIIGAAGGNTTTFVAVLRNRSDLLADAALPATMADAADLFASLPGSADPYSSVFAGALAGRGADDHLVSEDEAAALWGLWDPVVKAADSGSTPLRVYEDGDKAWAGIGVVGTVTCHDKSCALAPGAEGSKWLAMSRGSLPPMVRDIATDMLVQEKAERKRAQRAKEIRQSRRAARKAADGAGAAAEDASEVEDDGPQCVVAGGELCSCLLAFAGDRPAQPVDMMEA